MKTNSGEVYYRSRTELFIPVENFSERTYYEAPYKLFHEVAVHAVQASATKFSTELRPVYGSDCAMAEGLVDAVAIDILRLILLDNQIKFDRTLIGLCKNIDNTTNQMMWNRRQAHMKSLGSAGFLVARSCAYDIYDEMKKLYGAKKTAGIVMDLNLSELTKEQREFILSSMGIILDHDAWSAPYRDLLDDSLNEFSRHGDTDRLLADINDSIM
jgi:hypothetical protein